MKFKEDAAEIIGMCEKQKQQTDDIRRKMEYSYALATGRYFQGVSATQGAYENYISNKPQAFGMSVIEMLASMDMTYRIPVIKEGKKGRSGISDTEAFGYGIVNLADQRLVARGDRTIQDSLSFCLPIFGGAFIFELIHEEEDKDEVKTVCDIQIYDPLTSYWFMGSKGLIKYVHYRFADVESAQDEYGDDSISETESNTGMTKIYYAIDDTNLITICGNKIQDKQKHDLGYVPVHMQKVGSIPHIQIDGIIGSMKDSFNTIYDKNANLYEPYSRAMSYLLTIMGKSAKTPWIARVKGGKLDIDKDFNIQGGVTVLDSELVESLEPLINPAMPDALMQSISMMAREISTGSWADVAYGMFDSASPVGTTNMMLHTAMRALLNPQRAMEDAFTWISNEAINQYKDGDFKTLELSGVTYSNKRYKVKVKPEDIDDEWVLETKMHNNLPQDELSNMQVASQAVKDGLSSKETAMDKWLHVQDPDAELQKMALERAKQNPIFELTEQIEALRKEDEKGNENIITSLIILRDGIMQQVKDQYTQRMLGNNSGMGEDQAKSQKPTRIGGLSPALVDQSMPNPNAQSQNQMSGQPSEQIINEIANSQG